MYGNKLVIVLCIVGVVWACKNDDLRVIDSIRNEAPCSSAGGICTIASDCPNYLLTEEKGLCPEQQKMGVECCNGVSDKETRCQKRGGACMEWCNGILIHSRATDCPKNTKCCTLV